MSGNRRHARNRTGHREDVASEGADVAICGQRQDSVDQAVAELAAETAGKVKGKAADVKNDEEVGELFRFVDAECGAARCAGQQRRCRDLSPCSRTFGGGVEATVETNLYGAFYCSREALFRFGTNGAGYIVNIGSLAGANAFAGGAAYNASKFGLTGFTEAMMQDVRSENVRVSYIMPGSVATEFGGHPRDGADWKIWPEDVAEIVQMLLKMPPRTLVSRVEVRPARARSSSKKSRKCVRIRIRRGASIEMALGLPESLWRGELRQTAPPRRKAVDKMVRLNIPLDPGKNGERRDTTGDRTCAG